MFLLLKKQELSNSCHRPLFFWILKYAPDYFLPSGILASRRGGAGYGSGSQRAHLPCYGYHLVHSVRSPVSAAPTSLRVFLLFYSEYYRGFTCLVEDGWWGFPPPFLYCTAFLDPARSSVRTNVFIYPYTVPLGI